MTGVAPAERLENRYGRAPRRRRRLAVIVPALVLVLAAAVWAVWTGVGGAGSTLDLQTTGYVVNGPGSVTVSWTVGGDAGRRLVCAIEGQDASGEVLGLREVVVPVTGAADRSGTTTVRTTRKADNGLIQSCRDA